jgi:hypothetical protein
MSSLRSVLSLKVLSPALFKIFNQLCSQLLKNHHQNCSYETNFWCDLLLFPLSHRFLDLFVIGLCLFRSLCPSFRPTGSFQRFDQALLTAISRDFWSRSNWEHGLGLLRLMTWASLLARTLISPLSVWVAARLTDPLRLVWEGQCQRSRWS